MFEALGLRREYFWQNEWGGVWMPAGEPGGSPAYVWVGVDAVNQGRMTPLERGGGLKAHPTLVA